MADFHTVTRGLDARVHPAECLSIGVDARNKSAHDETGLSLGRLSGESE